MWTLTLIVYYFMGQANDVGITKVGTYETQQACEEAGVAMLKKFDTKHFNYAIDGVSLNKVIVQRDNKLVKQTRQTYLCSVR